MSCFKDFICWICCNSKCGQWLETIAKLRYQIQLCVFSLLAHNNLTERWDKGNLHQILLLWPCVIAYNDELMKCVEYIYSYFASLCGEDSNLGAVWSISWLFDIMCQIHCGLGERKRLTHHCKIMPWERAALTAYIKAHGTVDIGQRPDYCWK